MKVLFLIPKNPPPVLDGNFSKPFREFVSYCLQRDPRERPAARDLLKHKFVRLAKKTSYLTELIDRHERWKAEGGDRQEEKDNNNDVDTDLPENGDLEDLWDFGTVRHGGRNTVGRSQNSVRVSGPPLTWENNVTPQGPNEYSPSSSRRVSISSNNSSVTTRGELPPPAPSASSQKTQFQQSTVRHMPPGSIEKPQSSSTAVVSQPQVPQVEDYDDQYVVDTFSSAKSGILHKIQDMQLDDEDLPDTTMLDSVILPAIASLFPRVSSQEARVALSALQRAFTEAERIIPGVTLELVNEIVDSVEHVEDGR
jgi:serine/threonine-protein kinase 24/25/MST4